MWSSREVVDAGAGDHNALHQTGDFREFLRLDATSTKRRV